ncbi:MAG TPA: YidC/Oxa1 family membrane protein insertase, partial [Ktedonobacterales bacterium]|nr:YidC/Oxa1 family membrane protein insertase [Ktedonobacterales bacterium]
PFMPHLSTLPNHLFLWTDLGAADPFKILPILAGLLTFVQLRMAQPVKAPVPVGQKADPNTQAMGSMQYVMPFITFIMALNFPSGLAFYWTITTAFMAVQQYFLSGLGSLFLGIPGLEHLVPAPQSPPVLVARAAPAASIVDVTPTSNPPRGLAGLRETLRQLSAPPPSPSASASANGNANGNGTGKGASNGATVNGNAEAERIHHSTSNGGTPYVKKAKPDQQGPRLVRPDAQSLATSGGAGDGAARIRRQEGQGGASNSGARGGRGASGRKRSGGKSRGGR